MTDGTYNSTNPRFSRRWWLEQIHTLIWVVIVTLLVWVFADSQFTQRRDVAVTIHFIAATGSDLAILSTNDMEVHLTVEGNSRSLDEFEKRAKGSRIDIDVTALPAGRQQVLVPVEELLRRNGDFTKSGLNLMASKPASVPLHLDKMVTRRVPVVLNSTGATVVGEPVLTPSHVSIRIAQSRWQQIVQQTDQAVLKTKLVDLQKRETGKPVELTAEIDPQIAGIPVAPQRSNVDVKLQIENTSDTYTFGVNVRVLVWPTWQEKDNFWKEYQLVRADDLEWRPQITVTGSRQDLERLKANEKDVIAFIMVTDEDRKPVSWNKRSVTVHFPQDVNVQMTKAPTVNFRLEKRQ